MVPEPVIANVTVFKPVKDSSSAGPFEKTMLTPEVLDASGRSSRCVAIGGETESIERSRKETRLMATTLPPMLCLDMRPPFNSPLLPREYVGSCWDIDQMGSSALHVVELSWREAHMQSVVFS